MVAGLAYALGCSMARPGWAVVPAAYLLLGLDAAPERWEPHPGWLSTAFALLTVWLFPRHPLAAGAAAGLTFAFKQNTGFLILGAGLLFAWLNRASGRSWPGGAARFAGAFLVVSLAWLLPLLVAIDGQLVRLAPFVGGVNQAALFSPPEVTNLLPVVAGALGAWWYRCRCPHPLLAWYLVAGGFLFLTEYPRMDGLHVAWSGPLLLVVGAVALDALPVQTGILALSALVLATLPTLAWRADWVGTSLVTLADLPSADGLIVPDRTRDDLVGVVDDVRARTASGEPIFVYPTSPLLYVVAERPNPTRYDHLYPGAAPPNEVQAVIERLEGVRVVVTSSFWPYFWGPPGDNAPLEAYLAAEYREVARYGAYHVLERTDLY
jgi:hypothetical protein